VVGSKRPHSGVSVFEIASASLPVTMRSPPVRDHCRAWISNGAGQTLQPSHGSTLKGGDRSGGLAARGTQRYRYPALSSQR
jgi:hypothetical protein